ncbi:MAG: hypothetical protein WDN23_18335 [Edaphobacter sp.]
MSVQALNGEEWGGGRFLREAVRATQAKLSNAELRKKVEAGRR